MKIKEVSPVPDIITCTAHTNTTSANRQAITINFEAIAVRYS